MFAIISKMSLDSYIKNRKLTNAAYDIVSTNQEIKDIAQKYGYEEKDIFTTEFKSYHGYTPKQVREIKKYKVFSPLYFYKTPKTDEKIKVRFESRGKFAIAGLKIETENIDDFSKVWEKLFKKYDCDFLSNLGDGKVFGACYNFRGDSFSYIAGYDFKKTYRDVEKNGLEVLEIPESYYAVFTIWGSIDKSILKGWEYIMEEFLPKNGYIHSETPDFELYLPGDIHDENYKMEIWVPVEKI